MPSNPSNNRNIAPSAGSSQPSAGPAVAAAAQASVRRVDSSHTPSMASSTSSAAKRTANPGATQPQRRGGHPGSQGSRIPTAADGRQQSNVSPSASSSSSLAPITLFVHSSAGRSMLQTNRNSTVLDLKRQISERLKLSSEPKLYLDPKYEKELRSSADLVDGTIIHVGDKAEAVIQGQCVLAPRERSTSKDLSATNASQHLQSSPPPPANQALSSSSSPPLAAPSSSPTTNQQSSLNTGDRSDDASADAKSNFLAFDAYLDKHNYDVSQLPNKIHYGGIDLRRGSVNKLPPTVTLKHQQYRHVDHLEFMNVSEIQDFVQYWRKDLDMGHNRGGFLYGYYVEDSHYDKGIRAVAEGIYEPPQQYSSDVVLLLEDPFRRQVDAVAERLGLERIGWVFTHLPRDMALTSNEVVQIAKMQNEMTDTEHYTQYPSSRFVTCTVSPSIDSNGDPVPNVYMVSDMGQAFERHNLLHPTPPDPLHLALRQAGTSEVLPEVLESGRTTTKFDSHWFIVRVNESAPKVVRSRFDHSYFPRENRRRLVGSSDVKKYFQRAPAREPSYQKVSDFHFLLYVAKQLDLDSALACCDAIVQKKPLDEHFLEFLEGGFGPVS